MELLTVAEVAGELGISPQRVREFCREGRLGTRLGREWAITRKELESFKDIPREPGRPPAATDEEGDR